MGIIPCSILIPFPYRSLQSPGRDAFLRLDMDPVIFLALSKQCICADPARLHQNKRAAALLAPFLFIYFEASGGEPGGIRLPHLEAGLAEGLLRWCVGQMARGNPQGNAD